MPTTSSAIPSPSQPSGERSRGGRGARGSGGASTEAGGRAAGGVAPVRRTGRPTAATIGVVPIQQHPAADEQDGPDEPGVELRGDRRGAREEQQHPDRRADAREPPRQPARGGDADVLARDEDPQKHVGDHRDAEQRPDLPRDHHERQAEQGPHGQRAHAEGLREPAGHARDHLVRGTSSQRAVGWSGGLEGEPLGGHGALARAIGGLGFPARVRGRPSGTMMAVHRPRRHPGCPWKDPEIVPRPGDRATAGGPTPTWGASGMSPMSSPRCAVPPCAGCSDGAPPTAS